MPSFTRKYRVPCEACHDAPTYPRLNDFGYKFRRAGFRLPEEIGQDVSADFNLGDYFAGRIQVSG